MHPVRTLITEFTKAFIYINRHLLYTEGLQNYDLSGTHDGESSENNIASARELRKSIQSQQRKHVGHMSESQKYSNENLDQSKAQELL